MDRFKSQSSGPTSRSLLSPPSRTLTPGGSRRLALSRTIGGALKRLTPQGKEEDHKPGKSIKGPLGLTELSAVPDPIIEFIFIHGLGGGSQKTWSLTSDPYHYWPKHWLHREEAFARVNIHSFGYNADWTEKKESLSSVHDFSRSLLNAIYCDSEIRGRNVTHSMGGIVAKKAYMLAREDRSMRAIANRINTIYFLATPHRGADLAKSLGNILKVSGLSKTFVNELQRTSDSISSINDSFRHFAEDLHLWSFYETVDSDLGFTSARIVDKNSATLGYSHEMSSPLDADHRGICKFNQETDSNYQTLLKAFITTIDSICTDETQAAAANMAEQQGYLAATLGLNESFEDRIASLEDLSVPGSCVWLTVNPLYQEWQAAQPSNKPIFWLVGNAGSGKSTLCTHIISELRKNNLKCSYFFFEYGNSTRSAVAQCLLTMAYQTIMSDMYLLQQLLKIKQYILQIEQWDEKMIWRKLFVQFIFTTQNKTPQYWVIDAVDECRQFPVLLTFLSQLPSYLRVFISSRNTSEIERNINVLAPSCEVHRIREKDTLEDLNIYVDSKMDRLPASDDESRQRFKKRILEKASGSFLWTSLVVKELETAYSEESAEEILNEVPIEMNKFYARMVESIVENRRAVNLAASIFRWTLHSLRPLKVPELLSAIKSDTGQTVNSLEKSISSICSHLVILDHKDEIHITHMTAREYLIQEENFPGLTGGRPSHTNIAGVCLRVLTEHLPEGSRAWTRRPSASNFDNALTSYACEYFSDHLNLSSSEELSNWNLLFKFLQSNVLAWIEWLAKMGNLRSIARTAKNLQMYMKRRLKYTTVSSRQEDELKMWTHDLIRLHGKFGPQLELSPSSIRVLIPAMCPSESILALTYAPRTSQQSRFHVTGLVDQTWNDCLIQIDYQGKRAMAVTYGNRYVAVAFSDGIVIIYYYDSTQPKSSYSHGERWLNMLSFSNNDQYLASGGKKMVKVWDVVSESLLWTFNTTEQSLVLHFVNDTTLVAANLDCHFTEWDLQKGTEARQWCWKESMLAVGQPEPWGQPDKAAVSGSRVLAICSRDRPVHLFDTETERFIGYCSREDTSFHFGMGTNYRVDALAFNKTLDGPNVLLIVSYWGGELVIYDVESLQLRYRASRVFAHCLACSPDGRTLVTASTRGRSQIFEFSGDHKDHLALIYRINNYGEGIKSIAFGQDGRHFADIRSSQYRVWEPIVLMCDNDDDCTFSQAITPDPKTVDMFEKSPLAPTAEIAAITSHPNDEFVFCGGKDGSVVGIRTCDATQSKMIYRHAAHANVINIAYNGSKDIIISADDSGRILVYKLVARDSIYEVDCQMADIRAEDTIMALLPNLLGSKFLISHKGKVDVWTTEGTKCYSIPMEILEEKGQVYSERAIANNHLDPNYFLCVDNDRLGNYSWEDIETIPSSAGNSENGGLSTKRPTETQNAIIKLQRTNVIFASTSTTLLAWRCVGDANSNQFTGPVTPLGKQVSGIRQLIAVEQDFVLFLDTRLWVCSVDLSGPTQSALNVKRHFFLLTEWQSYSGRFIIEYIQKSREFVLAKRDGILVMKRGLEVEEPWVPPK